MPRRLLILSSSLLVVLVGGATWYALRGSRVERGNRALVRALSNKRCIEARLSGGARAAPFDHARGDLAGADAEALEEAKELILGAVLETDSADVHLAYGRLLLVEGDKKEALRQLRKAAKLMPTSSEAHNDLGVSLLEQGKLEDALEEFEKGLSLRREMPEALFNRALCFEKLLLRDAARTDYERLSQIERDDGWLTEVNSRREKIARPITPGKPDKEIIANFEAVVAAGNIDDAKKLVAQNSEVMGRHAIMDLCVRRLQTAAEGDREKADQALFEIELIGSVLNEARRDSMTADIAQYLKRLPESETQLEREMIKDYTVGVSEFESRTATDITTFERLQKQFRGRGNQMFEALSAFRLADCYYYVHRYGDTVTTLQGILPLIERREWPVDRVRVLALLGLQYSVLGRDSVAIKYFEQALSLAERAPRLRARIMQYLSFPYFRLGNLDAALARLRDSTEAIMENGLASGLFLSLAYNYFQIADIYSRRNQHSLALLYAEHALSFSEQENVFDYAAEFSSFIAAEHARARQFEQAEQSLKRASDHLARIEPGSPRDLTEARLLINSGEVAVRQGDTARADGYYQKAEALAAREHDALLMIDVLRGRAEEYIASGQNERARSDLIRAVGLLEEYRSNIETSEQRSNFLDASHKVFDQLISLEAGELGRPSEAFERSEQSRARALLEEIRIGGIAPQRSNPATHSGAAGRDSRSGAATPLKLAEVQSRLPDDATVLQYAVTGRITYLFLVTRSGFKVVESSATTELLDRLVRDYVASLLEPAPIEEVDEKARVLYDYLIKPVESEISGKSNLCIVPDKALHFLPFAALVGKAGYLINSHSLTYGPSASVLVQCIKEGEAKGRGGSEKILAVGNPAFNRESLADLLPLTDAEREADESARFYSPESVVLKGADATERRVRAAMTECDVADLALHCLVEESSPWLAALVLAGSTPAATIRVEATTAGERGLQRSAVPRNAVPRAEVDPDDGLLYLDELYGIKLPRTKLVVLSACQSGLGHYYRGEGIVSLVRPFLAASVPTVMASLWPVDSRATSDLIIGFHRQRTLSGRRAAEALRATQLEMLQQEPYRHPYYWAPFIIVGNN